MREHEVRYTEMHVIKGRAGNTDECIQCKEILSVLGTEQPIAVVHLPNFKSGDSV